MKIILIIYTVGLSLVIGGCSIYEAAHAPEPVEYKQLKVGVPRDQVISLLGYPKMTEQKENLKTDSFEFVDGYNAASKSRIILYLAGDLFTAGLAEVIFWPLEANALDGKQCRGSVTYSSNEKVIGYDIKDKEGQRLWFSPLPPPPKNKPN
ncbi:hypothetical protein [Methyloglobulus sp.]|uniref:hypothetical protein n=1 Tax=Methyloglobulus sp. TaxID=2518622 RepID=UPI0017E6B5B6|nr:hypothetical protein [Methyloglobulus sp.]